MSARASLGDALGQTLDRLAEGGDAPETVREVVAAVVEHLGYDRGSLIASVETSHLAYVLAATDDPGLTEFVLEVQSYPEIVAALRTGQPLFIADVARDPLTAPVRDNLAAARVRALAVFPIVFRRRSLGVLLLRKEAVAAPPTDDQIVLARVVAGQLGLYLRDSHVIERLRDETRKISRASYEAERRLRTIDSLKEHFEASADGVFVVDEEARLVFANNAAISITGFARERLIGSPLGDFVPERQKAPLTQVVAGVLGGTNLNTFDLELYTTGPTPITVSVATSTVLSRSGAAIFSFRDVTSERVLESELSQTKDFLQKLIDSAVDAIIAADLDGRIILFNPGAERLTSFAAAEVIGVMPISDLYPPGTAREVMAMLRATTHGGVGRLEETRQEIRTKDGTLVPVNMTASIIYDQGQEVATVGIFSDLRDRLLIEQRLALTQERLEAQEREAMVAELAGAAAHELNQPLTSIMGYGELLLRRADPEAAHRRELDVIMTEAKRMAEIVKKIGRITKYETKEYVGGASIIDLDRATAPSGPNAVPTPPPAPPPLPPPTATAIVEEEVEDEPTSRINLDELLAGKTGTDRRAIEPAEDDGHDVDVDLDDDPTEGDDDDEAAARRAEQTVAGSRHGGRPT
jgi:PAS domain S-box-containing protein